VIVDGPAVVVPPLMAGEVAEAIRWHVRSGRQASPGLYRLAAELVQVDETWRLAAAITAAGMAGWVGTKEAGRVLGIAPRTVRERCQKGTLYSRMERGRWLIHLPAGPL
jgi:hypothetical protein